MATLNDTIDLVLEEQIKSGEYKTKDEVTQDILQLLIERYIDNNINLGMSQIKNGQGMELNKSFRENLNNRIINRLQYNKT